jgi:hypothetical protein
LDTAPILMTHNFWVALREWSSGKGVETDPLDHSQIPALYHPFAVIEKPISFVESVPVLAVGVERRFYPELYPPL